MAAKNGAITREVLRQFCAQYPSQKFSDEFVEMEAAITKLVESEIDGAEAASVRDALKKEAPHKIDENMWRNRQMNEHIIDVTDAKGTLATSIASDLLADIDAIRTKSRECLAAIVKLQKDQYDHVQKLVNKFLPNDFRTRMFIAYQKRSEQHAADDLDNYMKKGGTIAGKYDRLWAAQLKRRQMLAAVGNASGVFKALIKYLAGVPQSLLDFIHTINDDQGPMEEIRVTYGPVLYRLTAFINLIHVAVAMLVVANASLGYERTRDALQLVKQCTSIYQIELAACLVTTLAVFENSPMISVAENSDSQNNNMSGQKQVDARGDFTLSVEVRDEHIGGSLDWEFFVESKDVEFSLSLSSSSSATSDARALVDARRYYYHEGVIKGSHKIEEKGVAVFVWNNTFSLMTKKTINYNVVINGGSDVNAITEELNEVEL